MTVTKQSPLQKPAAATRATFSKISKPAEKEAPDHLRVRGRIPGIGLYAYGVGSIVLGLTGLVWGDFATNWQHVKPGVPYREFLAYAAALCELLAGTAIFWRRTARVGSLVLTTLFVVFTALWIPEILRSPGVFDNWGNFFEEFSLVVAGMVAYAMLAPANSAWRRNIGWIARFYGLCCISFGLGHIIYFKPASTWVPTWIPPGQHFWTAATALFFLMGAAAILSGVLAGVASRLLLAQIAGFEVLIWIPKVVSSPHQHFVWAGNAISIALSAAAWVVSDAICQTKRSAAAKTAMGVPSPPAAMD